MRAVSPETEGTAFLWGGWGRLHIRRYGPVLPYVPACTSLCVSPRYRIYKSVLTYLHVCTNVSASLHERIYKLVLPYLQACATVCAVSQKTGIE